MILFFTKVINKTKNIEHSIYLKKKKKRLIHKNPTIISNNCVGGVISHDLGQRFCSPTVNLYFKASDFIKFISDIHNYLSLDLIEIESDFSYPVGKIGDITIFFKHYHSFDEAKTKWDERKKRVDYDNLYVMMVEREACSEAIVQQFDLLPIKHKVIFTHKEYPDINCAHYLKEFEKEKEVGIITDLKPCFWQRRYIDDYDYVAFLNQE